MPVKDYNSKESNQIPMWLNQFLEVNHGKGLGKHTLSVGCCCSLGAWTSCLCSQLGKLKPKLVTCDHAQQVLRQMGHWQGQDHHPQAIFSNTRRVLEEEINKNSLPHVSTLNISRKYVIPSFLFSKKIKQYTTRMFYQRTELASSLQLINKSTSFEFSFKPCEQNWQNIFKHKLSRFTFH